jgi:hypothetical protein
MSTTIVTQRTEINQFIFGQPLSTYWLNEGGTPRAQRKYGKNNPLPELVRVVGDNGEEICRWSVDDL